MLSQTIPAFAYSPNSFVFHSQGGAFTGTAGLDPTDLPMLIHDKVAVRQITSELQVTCPKCVDWLNGKNFEPDELKEILGVVAETSRIYGLDPGTLRAYVDDDNKGGMQNSKDGGSVALNLLDMKDPTSLASGLQRIFSYIHESSDHPDGGENYANLLGSFGVTAMDLANYLNGRERTDNLPGSATDWLAQYGDSEYIRDGNAFAAHLAKQGGTKDYLEPNLAQVEFWKLQTGMISYDEWRENIELLPAFEQKLAESIPLSKEMSMATLAAGGAGNALAKATIGAFDFGILWSKSLLDPFTGWYPGAGEQFTKTLVFMPDNLGNAFHHAMYDISYGDPFQFAEGATNLGLIFGPAAIGKYGELSAGLRGGGAVYYFDDVATGMVETGARQVISPSSIRAWDLADDAYAAIRTNKSDIATISENIDWPESRVARVKEHIFFKEHQLDSGVRRFDADPGIVNAWNRLVQGDHMPSDVNLMQHEIFESKFEGIFKTDYRSAHDAAIRAGRLWDPE